MHIQQMLNRIKIWGILRSIQHLELLLKFLKPFQNNVCNVSGCVILQKDSTGFKDGIWSATSLGRWYVSKKHPRECQDPMIRSRTFPRAPITLPSPSSLVHSGPISSLGKHHTHFVQMMSKEVWFLRPGHFLHRSTIGPVLKLTWPLYMLLEVDQGPALFSQRQNELFREF